MTEVAVFMKTLKLLQMKERIIRAISFTVTIGVFYINKQFCITLICLAILCHEKLCCTVVCLLVCLQQQAISHATDGIYNNS